MIPVSDIKFIPSNPGCYLFRNGEGEVLYVGKAKNLNKRVCSYFQKKDLDPKTKLLVSHIRTVDFIITETEVEALLLENNLIKKWYPPYNLDLKDSVRYAYLLIHDDQVPWIEVARKRESKGEYYGPFVSGFMRKLVLQVLARNFKILTKKPSPRLKKTILAEKDEYLQRVAQARQILKGNVDQLLDHLQTTMEVASKRQFYEYALTLRNQIQALEMLKEKQIVERSKTVDTHIINYSLIAGQVYLLLFSMRQGILEDKQEFSFTFHEDFLDEFIVRYYDEHPIPQEIIVPHSVDAALEVLLRQKSNRAVSICVPQKGDKLQLLQLVSQNIAPTFFTGGERVNALQQALNLQRYPRQIECFDISHLGGTNTVASMVSFKNGLPDKANYRKFKMRVAKDGDDYFAMQEVLRRRYSGTLKNTMKNPDLVVIDGGIGQLSAAIGVFNELHLKIPVISLAKKFEEIYVPGKNQPVRLDRKHKGLQLLQSIRDEAHRFALTYQRLLRQKSLHK